jgi:hypothetical protein
MPVTDVSCPEIIDRRIVGVGRLGDVATCAGMIT